MKCTSVLAMLISAIAVNAAQGANHPAAAAQAAPDKKRSR
jgi:hypothetical protein